MSRLVLFCLVMGVACGICMSIGGCAGSGPPAAPVDPEQARSTLRAVLEAWKGGESPESLQERSPSIVVQDMDWKMGYELVGYEVDGPGQAIDANLFCPVRLQLRSPDGKDLEKNVRYIVGTDPVLTVFREIF